jgi:uncharacterized OB-fold protein
MKAASAHCEDLDKKIDGAIENAKSRKLQAGKDDFILCNKCGSQVFSESKYCSECGSRLDAF